MKKLIIPVMLLVSLFALTGCVGAPFAVDRSQSDDKETYTFEEPDYDSQVTRKEDSKAQPGESFSSSDDSRAYDIYGNYIDSDGTYVYLGPGNAVDITKVSQWNIPPVEVDDFVAKINQDYNDSISLVSSYAEGDEGYRYYFQNPAAEKDRYEGTSLSIKVNTITGQYMASGIYCFDSVDKLLDIANRIAVLFGDDDYDALEMREIFTDKHADEGNANHYEGNFTYKHAYYKPNNFIAFSTYQ